jgi:hypothetical protein
MKYQQNASKCLIGIAALLGGASTALAAGAPTLGSATHFGVLSAATLHRGAVTCTDSSVIGDIGNSGYAPAVVNTRCSIAGSIIAPVTAQVLIDFNRAYTALQSNRCQRILTGTQAGIILAPGVYCFDAAATVTGTLTLNGPSTGVWIFLVNGDLTGNTFTTLMAGGGQACNVYWGSSGATTMTDSNLKGTVLAGQAVTLTRGSFIGRAFAKKAVTVTNMATNSCG